MNMKIGNTPLIKINYKYNGKENNSKYIDFYYNM